jgi:Carboxypeptidase regulatory-like domain
MLRQIVILSIFAFTLTAIGSSAYDTRATIRGRVTDSNKRAIVGAIVKAVNVETNQTTKAKTTTGGHFTLPNLNPGTYNLEVTAEGFKTLNRDHLVVRVADKIDLLLEMKVDE